MQSMNYVREGLQIAGRHKRLVLVLWLVPVIPALALAAMAASNFLPVLDRSIFADRLLHGDWWVVVMEFRASPADALEPILGFGVVVMAALTLLVQVMLSAGVVQVVLERTGKNPFVLGVRNNFLRFSRTAILMTGATLVAIVAARFVAKGMFKVAETQADGRFDVFGVGLAMCVFCMLWVPLDLASDLSRIAAARHDQSSMVRGFFRALGSVLRRPGPFVPMYLVFLTLPLLVHFVYYQLRSPWSAATVGLILVSIFLQQTVMLLRAFFKLGLWGAEVAAYRGLGEPEFCHPKLKPQPVGGFVEAQSAAGSYARTQARSAPIAPVENPAVAASADPES